MVSTKDLRLIFKYEFKLGHTAAQAADNVNKVYGKNTTTVRTVQRWFNRFRSGNMDTSNKPRGRPKPVLNDEELSTAIANDPRTTVRTLSGYFRTSTATISRHLKAIGKVKKLKKWVPHERDEMLHDSVRPNTD